MGKAHLIMPMGGSGSRFKKNGFEIPKPVIEIEGKPFFYWAARSIEKYVDLEDITFVALRDHIEKFDLGKFIKKYFPDAMIIEIPEVTPGPVFTSLEGVKHIHDEKAIIINDCDHMFKCTDMNDLLNSLESGIDGALVSFESQSANFSYIKYDKQGKVIGTVEKVVVSNHAICGAYEFRNAQLFREIADEYLKSCPYKESFLSGMYNVMCEHDMNIKDCKLDFHVEFGTPEEYKKAIGSGCFAELL